MSSVKHTITANILLEIFNSNISLTISIKLWEN